MYSSQVTKAAFPTEQETRAPRRLPVDLLGSPPEETLTGTPHSGAQQRTPADSPVRRALSSWDAMALAMYAEELTRTLGPAAGEKLAGLLESLRPVDRTWTLLYWALSERSSLRWSVALAAPRLPRSVGLYSAVDRLAEDAAPEVRVAAREAIALRGERAACQTH